MSERLAVFHYSEDSPQRLDKFLVECIPDLSRTRLQSLINDGLISVNGVVTSKPGWMLEAPAEICVSIRPSQPSDLIPENIPLEIVFENEDVIVINKPAGMVTHPAYGNYTGTLVNALLYHCGGLSTGGDATRPGIVHRLGEDTSGLMVIAKTVSAHASPAGQFAARTTTGNSRPSTVMRRIAALFGEVVRLGSNTRAVWAVCESE